MTFLLKTSHLYSGVRHILLAFTSLLACASVLEPLHAETDLVAISEREILKRQEEVKLAEQLVNQARRDLADKNLEGAYSNYLQDPQITPLRSTQPKKPPRLLTRAALCCGCAQEARTLMLARGSRA